MRVPILVHQWTSNYSVQVQRCLMEVMDTQLGADMALRILKFNKTPEGLEERPEGPYIEEGMCTAVRPLSCSFAGAHP